MSEALPAPGEELTQELPGIIYDSQGICKGKWHIGWIAVCQRCGNIWPVRARPKWSREKMPRRCPACWSRRWYQAPDQEDGNNAGSPPIAREEPEPGNKEDRIQELMARPDYDNKAHLVYYSVESPPTCSVCGQEVLDQFHITDKAGQVWCLDHAPHLQGGAGHV